MRVAALLTGFVFTCPAASPPLDAIENSYSDLNDAVAAIQMIDSGFSKSYAGRDRKQWDQARRESAKELSARLAQLHARGLDAEDTRAVQLMREKISSISARPGISSPRCRDAPEKLDYIGLKSALSSCFEEAGAKLEFEGTKVSRLGIFDRLRSTDDPARRKALFLALSPFWRAINDRDQPTSPYRRLIRLAGNAKPLTAAASTLSIDPATAESWMQQALETWARVSTAQPIEPWDFDYQAGSADRILGGSIPRDSLVPITVRYYRDLGADLTQLGVLYDLDPRPGKSPVAYTDFAAYGRSAGSVWKPSVPIISASYAQGSLSLLNELVHEAGHAIHISAVRTRPAFMDLGDSLFVEAFADVASWNTYQPAWQKKYLGRAASESDSLRSLYSSVIMDIAWALFEIRMLRDPAADPNQVWTELTSRYLHIVPHPEWSWWAVRGQLVDSPGYMINYGLGAVLTADLRRHTRESLGSFETGNPRWYPWLSAGLLHFGLERETPDLLHDFLGRRVSPQALLEDLERLAAR